MKKNYKKIILGLSFVIASATMQGQEFTGVGLRPAVPAVSTSFTPSTVAYVDVVHDGATFRITATLTADANEISEGVSANPGVYVPTNRRLGVSSDHAGEVSAQIEGDLGESLTMDNLTVTVIDAGAGYTTAAITNVRFTAILIRNANGVSDSPRLTVDGTNAGTVDFTTLNATQETITFGTAFTYTDTSTSAVLGNSTDVQSIKLECATTDAANSIALLAPQVSYTFTQEETLSNEFVNEEAALVIVPTVVSDSFTVNKDFSSVELIDVTGKTVKTFGAADALEVSGVTSGLYIVKVLSKSGAVSTSRLIVE